MADLGVSIFAIIGAIYLGLTAVILLGDRKRIREDMRYQDDQSFRKFVEAMKRIEDEEQA